VQKIPGSGGRHAPAGKNFNSAGWHTGYKPAPVEMVFQPVWLMAHFANVRQRGYYHYS